MELNTHQMNLQINLKIRIDVSDVIKRLRNNLNSSTKEEEEEEEKALSNVPLGFPKGLTLDPNEPFCPQCGIAQYTDPSSDQLGIYLHAYRYTGPGWSFKTNCLPEWVNVIDSQSNDSLMTSAKLESKIDEISNSM